MIKKQRNSVSYSSVSISSVTPKKKKRVVRGSLSSAKKKTIGLKKGKRGTSKGSFLSTKESSQKYLPTACSTEDSVSSAQALNSPVSVESEETGMPRTSSKDYINRGLYLKTQEEVTKNQPELSVRLLNALQKGFLVISEVKKEIETLPKAVSKSIPSEKIISLSDFEKTKILQQIETHSKMREQDYREFFRILSSSVKDIVSNLKEENKKTALAGITLVESSKKGLYSRMSTIIEEIESSSLDSTLIQKQDSLVSNLKSQEESIGQILSFASKSSSSDSVIVFF